MHGLVVLILCVFGTKALDKNCLCVYEDTVIRESPENKAKQIETIQSGNCIQDTDYELQGSWVKLKKGGFFYRTLFHRMGECEEDEDKNLIIKRNHHWSCDTCNQQCTCENFLDEYCRNNCWACDRHLQNNCNTVWGAWGECTKSCGGGQRYRDCTANCHYEHHSEQFEDCNTQACPTDTVHSQSTDAVWSKWSSCTHVCGGGTRTRRCLHHCSRHCHTCNSQSEDCNTQACHGVHHNHLTWGEWSGCSETCGGGTRTRHCKDRCYTHCDECNIQTDQAHCKAFRCPVDGHWSSYSAWSTCSKPCGSGQQQRNRTCIYPDHNHRGNPCVGSPHQEQPCNTHACRVDGHWSDYSAWSTCSKTCGSGQQQRTRTCIYPDHNHRGHKCVGSPHQEQPCNTHACPVDGHWSDYSAWSTCSKTCGSGQQQRTRTCIYPDHNHRGHQCAGSPHQEQPCNTHACPADGHWSDYSVWSDCSRTCGTGTHTRHRSCISADIHNKGKPCIGDATEVRICYNSYCPDHTCNRLEIFHEIAEVNATAKTRCRNAHYSSTHAFVLKHCDVPRNHTEWLPGNHVFDAKRGCNPDVPLFTPVASFSHGNPYDEKNTLSGVYVGCKADGQGIKVATKICDGFAEVVHVPLDAGSVHTTNAVFSKNPSSYFTIH